MCDSLTAVHKFSKRSSSDKAAEGTASNNCTSDYKSMRKVKERGAYVKMFVNLDTLGESITYYIDTGTEKQESELPLEPCVCTSCYTIFYETEQMMGEHCMQCQANEQSDFMYECNKCSFKATTQFESCLHYLEEGSCDGDMKVVRDSDVRKTEEAENQWDFSILVGRFCDECKTEDIECRRSLDEAVCNKCSSKLIPVCVNCGGFFKNYKQVKHHIKTKCLPVDHVCEECGFTTETKGTLKEHIRRKHTDDRKYKCKYCNFLTNERKILSKHLRSNHEPDQYHKCPSCAYCAQEEEALRRHRPWCPAKNKKSLT